MRRCAPRGVDGLDGPEASETLWTVATRSAAETEALGQRLGACARPGDALLLSGPVGAGKTVLAGGVLSGLGVPAPHPSPTFTLLRTYRGRLPAVHADLYRLPPGFASEEIGWDDELLDGAVAVVEWAERLGRHAPADAVAAHLEPTPPGRLVTVRATGPAARRWLAESRAAVGRVGR